MQPLLLKQLSIVRMPGLSRGLKKYDDLAKHVNIIFGPNASGKSSTARAIRELIWRQGSGEVIASAVGEFDGQQWELKLDGRRAMTRMNGAEQVIAGVPAWEGHARYTLALHELVTAVDGDLARQVIRESMGYDLDAAQAALTYASGTNSTGKTEYREFRAAKDAYDELFKRQDDLERDQRRLTRLIQELAEAEEAGSLLDWRRQLLEFMRARVVLKEAEALLGEYPTVLGELSGNEYQEIQTLKGQLQNLSGEIDRLGRTIAEAEERRDSLNLPEKGVPSVLREELREKIDVLASLERAVLEKERDIADAIGRENNALKRLGSQDTTEWDGVTWTDVEGLERHLQQAHQLLSNKTAIEAVIRTLGETVRGDRVQSEALLLNGINVLKGWLQDGEAPKERPIPAWSLWAVAVLALIPSFGILLYGAKGLIGLVLVFVVAAIMYFSRSSKAPDKREMRRDDYRKLGLPEPSDWTLTPVQQRVTELLDRLGEVRWGNEVKTRIRQLHEDLTEMGPALETMASQYALLKDRLKLVPDGPGDDIKTYDAMFHYLRYAGEWHANHTKRVGMENALRTMGGQREVLLASINELLNAANAASANDANSATAKLRQLDTDDRVWAEEELKIANAKRSIEERKERGSELSNKIRELYTKCEIPDGDEEGIRDLVARVGEYHQTRQSRRDAAVSLAEREKMLRENLLFASHGEEMGLEPAVIDGGMVALQTRAGGARGKSDEIAGIKARIEIAERGHSVETALKEKEDRLADLEGLYDDNLVSITGKLLIDVLKKQADDREWPAVFRRATTLFKRITNGAFELRLRQTEPPAFGALDAAEGEWRELEELSTGTRIQLLLAVRLAFIDSIETSVRLPIVADELLANSDPRRASAIVDALAEISREGRQIFYFTSQVEEVEKWRMFLADKSEIEYKIFQLDGQESEQYGLSQALPAFGGLSFLARGAGGWGKRPRSIW